MKFQVPYNPPAEGVKVRLEDCDGNLIDKDVTDGLGKYGFSGVDGDKELTINVTGKVFEVNKDVTQVDADINLRNDAGIADEDVPSELMNGSGTSSNPYEVETASDLQSMKYKPSAHYELVNDIDASSTSKWNKVKEVEQSGYAPLKLRYEPVESSIKIRGDNDFTYYSSNNSVDYDSGGFSKTFTYETKNTIYGGFEPIGNFSSKFDGSIDGNGHTISNIHVNRLTSNSVGAIFGATNGTVKNLKISNSEIDGGEQVGGVVGFNQGVVEDVEFEGEVDENYKVGGIAGVTGGEIIDTRVEGDITGYYAESDNGIAGKSVGGIAGENNGCCVGDIGLIKNSKVVGTVSGDDEIGGIVGTGGSDTDLINSYANVDIDIENRFGGMIAGSISDGAIVEDVYATGTLEGGPKKGGLVGNEYSFDSGATFRDSYWNEETSGLTNAVGEGSLTRSDATGLTTSEMQGSNAETNMDFDFSSVWKTVTDDYPELR